MRACVAGGGGERLTVVLIDDGALFDGAFFVDYSEPTLAPSDIRVFLNRGGSTDWQHDVIGGLVLSGTDDGERLTSLLVLFEVALPVNESQVCAEGIHSSRDTAVFHVELFLSCAVKRLSLSYVVIRRHSIE